MIVIIFNYPIRFRFHDRSVDTSQAINIDCNIQYTQQEHIQTTQQEQLYVGTSRSRRPAHCNGQGNHLSNTTCLTLLPMHDTSLTRRTTHSTKEAVLDK